MKVKKEIVNGKWQIYKYDFEVQHKVKIDVINTIRSSKVFIMGEFYSKIKYLRSNIGTLSSILDLQTILMLIITTNLSCK